MILNGLPDWQKLNVAAFLASSVAIAFPETHGTSLIGASGKPYLPFLKHPILVYIAESQEQLKRVFSRACERDLHIGIYTKELFATKNEEANIVEIAKHINLKLNLVSIVIYGENKKVDKVIDKLQFHD